MEAVRGAYADMRDTAEAAQAQLSEIQAAEKSLQKQLGACAQQVQPCCVQHDVLVASDVVLANTSTHCLLAGMCSDLSTACFPEELSVGCILSVS